MTRTRVMPSSTKMRRRTGQNLSRSPSSRSVQGTVDPIIRLQRTLGNRKVQQLLREKRLTQSGVLLRETAGITPAHALTVQRFGSLEHQSVGNEGSGHLKYQTAGLALDQGDLTMLRGDYFEEKDLLEFWKQPGFLGKSLRSQDEIIYAVYHATSGKDPRFGKGGPWRGMPFSDDVKNAVENRYYALANKNYMHFVNPGFGLNSNGMPIGGAGATYREAHERAISAAYYAGAGGTKIDDAQIVEAMGQHFLTDAFAAGHVSTRRGKIEKDWDARYPKFSSQIVNVIVRDMTDDLVASNRGLVDAPQKSVEAQVRITLNEKLAKKGQLTLGKFIGLVAHDYDNDNGLWFVNQVGQRWFGYGDGNLDKQPTGPLQKGQLLHRDIIQMAVKAGIDDVQHAYALGKSAKGLYFTEISEAVRRRSAAPAFFSAMFAPEMYMPKLDPALNQEQVIESDSIENLFETRIRRNGPGYRELIEQSVRGGTIHDELHGMVDELAESQTKYWILVDLNPKQAFQRAVINALEYNPVNYLIYVMQTG